MKLRNIISVCLLVVYALVMAHDFIPHHHHSNFSPNTNHCEYEHEQNSEHEHEHYNEHHHHHVASKEHKQVEHNHEHEAHIHCSFEEVLVLNKKVNLPEVNALMASFVFYFSEEENQQITDTYIAPNISEPHCRDVLVRGPPQFS
ncbi:MAG: hypothetical protein ABFS16_14625 [Bacteroidota bacterium]